MAIDIKDLDEIIESYSYLEDKLRRARNREKPGSSDWRKFDRQLAGVAALLDRMMFDKRQRMRTPIPYKPPVRFMAIEAV